MKGAVVYYTRWGNCGQVAESIRDGLIEAGHEVGIGDPRSIGGLDPDLRFIVIGSPTRIGQPVGQIKRFIRMHVTDAWFDRPFAAFGTGLKKGIDKGEEISADKLYKTLEIRGLRPLAQPFRAGVEAARGPLVEGSLDRAKQFGRDLGALLDAPQD